MTRRSAITVALIAALLSPALVAETVYVRDTLYVPLRAAPNEDARFVRNSLKSGTPLTLLSVDSENGFSHVEYRETNGNRLEGFIASQYLDDQPTTRMQLEDVQIERDQLQAVLRNLNERQSNHQASTDALTESLASANRQIDALRAELTDAQSETARITALASDSIGLTDALKSAKTRNQRLEAELAQTDEKIALLSETRDQQWFLIGSGVVLIGALVGFWISRRVYHRRFAGGWS